MLNYLLTLLCSASILLVTYFAIRKRKSSLLLRIVALVLVALLVLYLYFRYGDATQLYGLGILGIAMVYVIWDNKSHAEE